MKLDTSHMRYLTSEDFKVLQGVEQGSLNHECVPTSLIHRLSGMRSISGTNRSLGDLAKLKLVSRLRNVKYDGFRLTYNGIDYLALKALLNRESVYSTGAMIGIGKESDIYKVSDKHGVEKVMKLHRLGRTSFHTIKNNRDYLKKNSFNTNWMHLSKIAASKEYEFLGLLYTNGFNVPQPFDCSRHAILMEYIKGFPMRRLRKHKNLPKLYSDLMNFIVKLANNGLIHCDYNEFNIMIKDNHNEANENDLGFIVIDFPQAVSIEHVNADYYFKRDVDCIRRFFKKKLKYEPKADSTMLDTDGYGDGYRYPYPVFHRDVKRINNLDELVHASGFSKKHPGDRDLELAVESMRGNIAEEAYDSAEEYSDNSEEDVEETSEDVYSSDYDSEGDDDSQDGLDQENEKIINALSTGLGNLKMDKMGNYILDE
ncbi:Serine kinase [Hanseniaspora osmophila]|uniref:Serine/threonine-protein kinase RIO2 n=1 Tax=Hanseniaspora osmophila TaxID=56408 RepID=A0A1E5RP20_9ASCO|nr:Serine/threonine-protein kinase RIO2 [Hanseniaspora osmophila]